MSYAVQVNESNASRRVVYLWCVQSNGTSAATNEATGQPRMSVGGLPMWTTANTLSAISANAGLYSLVLGTSDISLLGQGTIQYSSGTALPTTVNVEIVGYDPFVPYSRFSSSDSVGLKAQVHSGASVGVVDIAPAVGAISALSFVPAPGQHSAVSIGGVTRVNSSVTIANADYSEVTVRVGGGALTSAVTLAAGRYSDVTIGGVELVESSVTIANADYSEVTVRVAGNIALTSAVTLAAGRYSDVTIGGVEALESAVTLAGGRYSDVTIGGVEALESGVTVATGGIIDASFAAGAIDAVAISTDAGQEFADRVLTRNIAGGSDTGRTVSQAFSAIRNRVAIDGSIGTVFQTNDTSSHWTFSVATVSANSGIIQAVDPG